MAAEKKHYVYVYGTLRPRDRPADNIVMVPGELYNVGAFPGARKIGDLECGHEFVAQRVEVDDEGLAGFDAYEGFNPDSHRGSLYIRKPWLDGWIYEFNHAIDETQPERFIESGDWFIFKGENRVPPRNQKEVSFSG